jgi:hypothetical protein
MFLFQLQSGVELLHPAEAVLAFCAQINKKELVILKGGGIVWVRTYFFFFRIPALPLFSNPDPKRIRHALSEYIRHHLICPRRTGSSKFIKKYGNNLNLVNVRRVQVSRYCMSSAESFAYFSWGQYRDLFSGPV